jgi:hypothetical protein
MWFVEGRGQEKCIKSLMVRCEGKKLLGRPKRRWEDNIKIDLQEMRWGAWTGLIWLKTGAGGRLL